MSRQGDLESVVRETRRRYSSEENIRIVLEGLRVAILVVLAITTFAVSPVLGEPTEISEVEPKTFFRGRPLPQCKAFFVTEGGYSRLIMGPEVQPDYFTFELGYMVNRGHNAWGATWMVGFPDGGILYGPRLRYGRWLSPDLRLEFSPGVSLTKQQDVVVQGSVALSVRDHFSVTSFVWVGQRDTRFYMGIALGSQWGVVAGVTGLLAAAIQGIVEASWL